MEEILCTYMQLYAWNIEWSKNLNILTTQVLALCFRKFLSKKISEGYRGARSSSSYYA